MGETEVMTAHASVVSITPFNPDRSLNEDGYRRHLRRLAAAGLTVFIAGEGCSEVLSLRPDELGRVLSIGAEELLGIVPVIAFGALGRNAAEQIEFLAAAEAAGLQMAGLYALDATHKRVPTEAELEAYYDEVLSSTSLDIVIACYSPRDAYVVSPQILARMAHRHQNFVEVQCSGPDVVYLAQVMNAVGPRIGVHSGGIEHALTNAALGGTGFVSAEANVTPKLAAALAEACREGRLHDAGRQMQRLIEVKRIHRQHGFIVALKAMLDACGLDGGPVRPPMLSLSTDIADVIRFELARLEIEELNLFAPDLAGGHGQ
jgi:dihydrodipicolinate synthase/N-acetylneuraminate lyase